MNTFVPFYIVSAALAGDSPREQSDRNDTLERQLRALGYATLQVNGAYKGVTEPAVLVVDLTAWSPACFDSVLRLGRQYGQESILAVDANRKASLVYCEGGELQPLGHWHMVSKAVAMKSDAYTERQGIYYVAQ